MCRSPASRLESLGARLWPVLVLLAAIALIYHPVANAYFFEDDFPWLVSRWTFHPGHLLNLGAFDHFYRPFIELYFWAGGRLFGGAPLVFHLVNVGLHAASACMLFVFARAISGDRQYGFVAALCFAVLPAPVEAVAWVSAVSELLAALFGICALFWWLRFSRGGAFRYAWAAVAAFACGLLTHESFIVFLPLLALVDVSFGGAPPDLRSLGAWVSSGRRYAGFVVLALADLAIDLTVSSRSYLVREALYTFGGHAVWNLLNYVASLYVGRRDTVSLAASGILLAVLLVRGTPRVRFGAAWLVLALLPFAFFTWGNVSRYQYPASMGFGLLIADAIAGLEALLRARVTSRPRPVVWLVVAAVAIRFAVFASEAVESFARRTETWREMGAAIRAENGHVPAGGAVVVEREVAEQHGVHVIEALARWEYRDPGLSVSLR